MVRVTVNGVCRQYRSPVTYGQLAQELQKDYSHKIVLAVANNKIKELNKNVTKDVTVSFQTTADRIGHDTYVRSALHAHAEGHQRYGRFSREGSASVEFSIARGISACQGENWQRGSFTWERTEGSRWILPLWSA